MEIDVRAADSAECMEWLQTSVPKTVWHHHQRPTENDEICTIVSGQMYKKVLFPEQMLEVLQHVAKIPRAQLEAIECGFQGNVTTKNLCDGPPTAMKGEKLAWLGNVEAGTHDDRAWHPRRREVLSSVRLFTCVPTKIRATGMDSPKATQDVEDGGNSEDSQRMDGFVRCCLRGIKSVVEIIGGQMYKKVLFAEQKLEVLQDAAKSLRKRNKAIEKGRACTSEGRKSCNMPREPKRIEATEKVRAGPLGAGKWRGRGGHARANLATCRVSGSKRPKKSGRKMVRRGRARTSKCRKSCNMPHERIKVIEKVRAGQPGQENGQGQARTSNRSKCRKSCNMLPKPT
ncbi:hypothetical protein EDB85DRAFT_1901339 [Lactarius pseudohatsudake]|nr:hypothetical protein EDB85DRAFT_1901339 [Lactarius pseudohatsudake]